MEGVVKKGNRWNPREIEEVSVYVQNNFNKQSRKEDERIKPGDNVYLRIEPKKDMENES